MNRATGREKGEEERKEKNQSNFRARAGNISVDSSCFIENCAYFEGKIDGVWVYQHVVHKLIFEELTV